ncbi:hypothetical protein F2Q69_00024893 [Brassica cretica]|uniref:DIRP domain-containing protein n=1 Tax=Brassica cretica TaxID=69181 RepID=A0A8S9QTX6_BRACR|nr:hypothetical protein F2Q69_00024893 [Brassica cretica]
MGPSRTSKSVYKRSNKEPSPEKELRNSSKTKPRKKRLTDKLGPQWAKVELERFYDAYRKHGRDWKKVAAAVRYNRSVDMVEALFNMNRAYLSLPEGTASVVGLIAMMTDHYSVIEESESEEEEEEEEEEGHGASGVSVKYQKRKLAKLSSIDFRQEVIPPHSVASAEGCLPFLKLTQAYGIERRAAGKRTPRFPVPSEYEREDREGCMPPSKRAKKQLEADDDDTLALAMANAVRRGEGSPYRRAEVNGSTSNGKMSQAKEAQSKHGASSMVRNVVTISRDRRHIKAAPGGALLVNTEGAGTVEKGKNVRFEEAEGAASNDSGEAGSANEGFKSGDEFEALQALAALSGLLSPDELKESESNPQLKEDRIANNVDEKPNTPETFVRSYHRRKSKQAAPEDSLILPVSPADANAVSIGEPGTSKRKRKTLHDKESAEDDNLKTMFKARRADQSPPKRLRTAKTAEESSSPSDKKITEPDAVVSATQVSGPGPASLRQRPPNRRKMSLKKSLRERAKISETTHEKPHSCKKELLKEQVSTCLSCPLVRRRCIYEWFYSAIDYPWFAKMEFIDFLNHLGIGTPRLTRLEWSVIKSSLGRTRRFSEKFIQEERDKLKQYRESARKHYTELRTGAREELPRDFAQPLSVGNRVIAIHPKTREVRDGKILAVDHNKCNVLFDDLGVDSVMDIDIMPLNPLEYMPDGLMRQIESKEAELNRHPSSDKSALFPPPVLENIDFSMDSPKKQALNYSVVSGIKHQDQTNGSFEHHHQSWSPSNTEGLMASELIASCLSTWLMIQRCTEKQYPPADVAQVMEIAVRSLEPRIVSSSTVCVNLIGVNCYKPRLVMADFQTSTQRAKWIFTPQKLEERYKAANQRAVQLLEKCGTTQVEVDASGSLTYPTQKVDAGGDQGDNKLKPLSVDEERFMRAFYEAKVQEVCSAFEFPHKIQEERYKAANQRAVQLLEKCGTTQVEVDASGSLTYPTQKVDAGGDQGDNKLKPLSVDEERFMRAFYEAKVQEVCSAFEFPHKIQATALQYFKRFYLQWLTCVYAACKIEENHVSAEEIGKGIKQDHHVILKYEMASLEFDLIVYAPYRAIEGFVSNMESLLKAATAEADKVMLTDAPLLFPPGQLALAALRIANGVLGVVDFDRYLENIVSQPNSEHTTSELIKLLDEIEYLVKNYKYPSEKDMKHINRKLKSCLGHSSSHDESKKREKRSKHKSHRNSSDTPKGPPIG